MNFMQIFLVLPIRLVIPRRLVSSVFLKTSAFLVSDVKKYIYSVLFNILVAQYSSMNFIQIFLVLPIRIVILRRLV